MESGGMGRGKGEGASFVTNKGSFVTNKGSPSGSKGSGVLAPGRWLRKVENKFKNLKCPLHGDLIKNEVVQGLGRERALRTCMYVYIYI